MNHRLLALALGTFAIGTGSFVFAGLLGALALDSGSLGSLGWAGALCTLLSLAVPARRVREELTSSGLAFGRTPPVCRCSPAVRAPPDQILVSETARLPAAGHHDPLRNR